MVVCHCRGISDRTIRKLARAGAEGVVDVARTCGAGGRCGGCRPTIAAILEEERVAGEASGSELGSFEPAAATG